MGGLTPKKGGLIGIIALGNMTRNDFLALFEHLLDGIDRIMPIWAWLFLAGCAWLGWQCGAP